MITDYGSRQPGTTVTGHDQSRQIRRAWGTLITAFTIFSLLCATLAGASYWYRGHATVRRAACVEVLKGERAFIRPAYQRNWNAIPRGNSCVNRLVELHEGDSLQTGEGTHLLLTLWNSSTVEVFEDTELEITELRTTQYISRASTASILQRSGLLRAAMAPGAYERSRMQVVAGDTTVLMKEGEGGSGGGSFIVQVTPGADPDDPSLSTIRASVLRGVGTVRVANQSEELRLEADEQTIIPPGGPPGDPTPSRRDLVANGTFEGSDGHFTSWTSISTPGEDGPFGKLTRVQDTIDGQPVTALEISRSMSSVDPANTGLRQVLDVNVADLPSLTLSADIKVFEQNIAGGGQLGSEFPIIVRINYYDPSGAIQNRIWGYYVAPPVNGSVPPNGKLVEPGKWELLNVDLRLLVPQPLKLESIEIYASGHGYRARITNVAIVGTEVPK
ncbi:MAG: hypothetical protein U0841_28830 [Chloroflexia bacterium]